MPEVETIKSAHHSIGDTISELAAALTKTGNCPDLPGKLMAFSKEGPNLSCKDVALKVVADLVATARNSSSTFKTYLANFVQTLFPIARASEDKNGVREMAVEVLLCIVEAEDLHKCLSIPEFASEFVRILMDLMLKAEEVGPIDWDDEAVDFQKHEMSQKDYHMSKKGLNRVASEIGEENVKNIIFGHILEYLKKDEFHYKQVATMALSETVEHLPEEGIDAILDEIIEILKVHLKSEQKQVRFLTCHAFYQLALHVISFPENHAKDTLPLLLNMFDDPNSEVQPHAVSAFTSIAGKIETAELLPFADQLIDKFLKQIKPENPTMLRKESIIGIAVVSSVIKKKFMKYYSTVVPVIKKIIVASTTEEEKTIRGKAMDCISKISESVGDAMIQADAHEVMQALLHIDTAGLEADDPLKGYIRGAMCKMCLSLKREFLPYLPQLIPNALKVLNVEPQPHNDKKVDGKVMTIVADGKCTELKKSEINEIIGVINLLTTFIQELYEQFGEYLVPVAQSLLSLLSFPPLFGHYKLILGALADVFIIARDSSDPAFRKMHIPWVAAIVENVLKDLDSIKVPCDKDAGIKDSELTEDKLKRSRLTETIFGLCLCLHVAGPDVLNAQQVGAICEKVLPHLKESNQRRDKLSTPDCDSDPGQFLRQCLVELLGAVMAFHPDLYLQIGAESYRKFIETHLDPNCIAEDRELALYVFDNVLKHLKDKGAPLWPTFAPRLIECIGDPDHGVRLAAFGCVIQAAKCPQFPAEFIQKAADQLFALISAKQSVLDDMITALGTIVVHRSSCLQPSPEQFVNLWINNLPLNNDYKEGHETHGDLVDLLVQKNSEVLGPKNANLPKLAKICATIYRSNFTTAKIDEGIRDFMQKIGFGVISSAGANFDEKLQKKLKRIQRDSQI